MKKLFEKGSEMFSMFMDYWKLVQDFWIPEKSDDYWNDLVKKENELYAKYNNSEYLRDMLRAFSKEVERRYESEK